MVSGIFLFVQSSVRKYLELLLILTIQINLIVPVERLKYYTVKTSVITNEVNYCTILQTQLLSYHSSHVFVWHLLDNKYGSLSAL